MDRALEPLETRLSEEQCHAASAEDPHRHIARTITPSFRSPSAATSYPFRRFATGCARLADQLGSNWHHIMPREDVGGARVVVKPLEPRSSGKHNMPRQQTPKVGKLGHTVFSREDAMVLSTAKICVSDPPPGLSTVLRSRIDGPLIHATVV